MIFVVDDQKFDRYIVTRRLSENDIFQNVTEAESGEEFLDLFGKDMAEKTQDTPVLVLMDINMPGLNGFETAKKLQERVEAGDAPSSLGVMMCTSSENPDDRRRAEEIDIIKGYIVKPLDRDDVAYLQRFYTG